MGNFFLNKVRVGINNFEMLSVHWLVVFEMNLMGKVFCMAEIMFPTLNSPMFKKKVYTFEQYWDGTFKFILFSMFSLVKVLLFSITIAIELIMF